MAGDSFVPVDHECLGGTRDEALAASAGYAGQVWTYAEAIAKATGKRAAGCFVHLVAQGIVAALQRGAAQPRSLVRRRQLLS